MEENPAAVDWFIPLFIGFQPSFWWCRMSQPSTGWGVPKPWGYPNRWMVYNGKSMKTPFKWMI